VENVLKYPERGSFVNIVFLSTTMVLDVDTVMLRIMHFELLFVCKSK